MHLLHGGQKSVEVLPFLSSSPSLSLRLSLFLNWTLHFFSAVLEARKLNSLISSLLRLRVKVCTGYPACYVGAGI